MCREDLSKEGSIKVSKEKEDEIKNLTAIDCRTPGCNWTGSLTEFKSSHLEECQKEFKRAAKVMGVSTKVDDTLTASELKNMDPETARNLAKLIPSGSLAQRIGMKDKELVKKISKVKSEIDPNRSSNLSGMSYLMNRFDNLQTRGEIEEKVKVVDKKKCLLDDSDSDEDS